MSVTTTADEKRSNLKLSLALVGQEANRIIATIGEMTDPDTWGSDEWSAEFVATLSHIEHDMVDLRRKIYLFQRSSDWRE